MPYNAKLIKHSSSAALVIPVVILDMLDFIDDRHNRDKKKEILVEIEFDLPNQTMIITPFKEEK